jgi:hypothetical protein
MAATIYYAQNSYLKINGVDLSTAVSSLNLLINYDQLDISAAGDSAHKYLAGMTSDVLSGTLFLTQDAASAGAVRATLDACDGTSVLFEVAPNGATPSATNPVYKGSCFINNYATVSGSQGEIASIDFSFDVTARDATAWPKTSV